MFLFLSLLSYIYFSGYAQHLPLNQSLPQIHYPLYTIISMTNSSLKRILKNIMCTGSSQALEMASKSLRCKNEIPKHAAFRNRLLHFLTIQGAALRRNTFICSLNLNVELTVCGRAQSSNLYQISCQQIFSFLEKVAVTKMQTDRQRDIQKD